MKRHMWLVGSLICVLLLSSCSSGLGQALLSPTPFPTLPATSTSAPPTSTPTPYVFRPEGADQSTPSPALSPTPPELTAIPVDGELASLYPLLEVTFPEGMSGKLLALHVQFGHRVQAGDLIATLDDGELRKAVQAAQLVLDKAITAKARADQEAEDAYQRAKEEAEWGVEMAKHKLQVAEMLPPTAELRATEVNIARLREAEEAAAVRYKEALDKPWENQEVRDALYKEWQRLTEDHKLAEMQLSDLQTGVKIYYLELEFAKREVQKAEASLARIEKKVDPAYDDAIAAAERQLAQAQEPLQRTQLYAPRAGLVIEVHAFAGSMVDGSTPIVTLLSTEDLYFVTLNLSERHAPLLRPGQRADITLRAYPDRTIAGQVEMVLPERTGEARLTAYIRLLWEDPGSNQGEMDLWPGMTGRAEVAIGNENR